MGVLGRSLLAYTYTLQMNERAQRWDHRGLEPVSKSERTDQGQVHHCLWFQGRMLRVEESWKVGREANWTEIGWDISTVPTRCTGAACSRKREAQCLCCQEWPVLQWWGALRMPPFSLQLGWVLWRVWHSRKHGCGILWSCFLSPDYLVDHSSVYTLEKVKSVSFYIVYDLYIDVFHYIYNYLKEYFTKMLTNHKLSKIVTLVFFVTTPIGRYTEFLFATLKMFCIQ